MKIGLCGTISIGKTTLVNALSQLPEFKDYHIATERSKYLRDLGVKLNTDSTVKGQLLFIAERSSELFHENLIADRTPWCVSAFTWNANSIDIEDKQALIKSAMLLKDEYDYIFYISPEGLPIEDNGVRTTDPEYRLKIDSTINDLLEIYPPKQLITISGLTAQRVEIVKSILFS